MEMTRNMFCVEELDLQESMAWWETALAVVGVLAGCAAAGYAGYAITAAVIAT